MTVIGLIMIGATAKSLLNQINNYSFVFYSSTLHKIFSITNQLSNELQSINLDIVNAIELSYLTIAHLDLFKTTGFREILENTLELCEDNDFPLQKVGRGRGNKDSIFDENEYLVKFNKIVDRFIDDISDRFDKTNYMAPCELYKLFTNKN